MVSWAFIFKSQNCHAEVDHMVMHHAGDRLLVYGVSTVEEGVLVAQKCVQEEGCTIVELCGGFGVEGGRAVKRAVGEAVQVGYVTTAFLENSKYS